METFDEKQLLKAISEGDEKAFKTFFLYYYPRIKGFINGLLQSHAVYRHIERTLLFRNYQQKETEKHSPPQESNETDDTIHLKELELLVTMVVEKMPPQRQKIYKMSRESGINNEEIARELSINKRTVENHLSQALTDIRKALFITFILFF